MKPLLIQDVRKAVGAKPLSHIEGDVPAIQDICTDSRSIRPSSLFIAIRGERFDGHQFLGEVAAKGAIAALVQQCPATDIPNLALLQVPDTRKALGKLAGLVRQQVRAKVIAVAGSNGKTSTKRLVHAALSTKLKGTCSPKSFNNDIGVPLTIFSAGAGDDYLVLEMGTNHPGEILNLATIGRPDIAIITNCSAEHLEGLGDLERVRRENASIIEGLDPKTGLLIVNGDDPQLLEALGGWKGRRLTFGFGTGNDLFATDVCCAADGVRFHLNGNEKFEFFVPLLGRHSACNALAAIAVARRLGMSDEQISHGLAKAEGPDMRLQLRDAGGVKILNDAYNANPASMRAAIETAATLPASGRRIAILGDMLELGPTSDQLHREVGQILAQLPFDLVYGVGTRAKLIVEAAVASVKEARQCMTFADSVSAAPVIASQAQRGDLVLLKGSRGMRLEIIAEAIVEQRGARAIAS